MGCRLARRRNTSLLSSRHLPALILSLPRALAGTCLFLTHQPTPGRISTTSRLTCCSGRPACSPLRRRRDYFRALGGIGMDYVEGARGARRLSHPYRTGARSLGRTFSRVRPRTSCSRACTSPPPGHAPVLKVLAPTSPPPTRARASFTPASRARDLFVSEARRGAGVNGKAGMGMGAEREREGDERVGGNGGARTKGREGRPKDGEGRSAGTRARVTNGWVGMELRGRRQGKGTCTCGRTTGDGPQVRARGCEGEGGDADAEGGGDRGGERGGRRMGMGMEWRSQRASPCSSSMRPRSFGHLAAPRLPRVRPSRAPPHAVRGLSIEW
ncbi:hypothetical protein C8F04DRAFT_191595 [Mycena alexandri]|uniref:Uncharacterized protein n=1 Tax=Mycena alexandri TaxID=1745969 RepID=A0AAD6S9G3_9AGAR|nr:hypothetical protein C8F04DRAFT_191595 [Mycena alexandri]